MRSGRLPYIPRTAARPVLQGRFAGDSQALVAVMGEGHVAVADLTLGAWRPHQVAAEIAAQLDVRLEFREGGQTLPSGPAVDPEVVGSWIDDEARGDAALRGGLDLATQLARGIDARDVPVRLVVLTPRFGGLWGRENLALLRFLADAAAGIGTELLVVATGPAGPAPELIAIDWTGTAPPLAESPPPAHPVDGVPGVLDPALQSALRAEEAGLVALARGHALVAPERRRPVSAFPDAMLGVLEHADRSWLAAYARAGRCPRDGRVQPLIGAAWQAFGAGAGDLALHLLDHAFAAARDAAAGGAIQAARQNMRLILQRYAEMADAPDPDGAVAPGLARWLVQIRAWGRIMAGRPDGTCEAMGTTMQDGAFSPDPLLDLYLRNINALMLFRSGDSASALAAEDDIARRLAADDRALWHLRYLNAINTARLHRAADRLDEARQGFETAFAISDGVRIPHETFYAALCRADLDGMAGRAAAAFRAVLEAALHWLANPAPETMGWRAAAAAVGRRTDRTDPELVAAALDRRLADAARDAGIAGAPVARPPVVLHAGIAARAGARAIAAAGGAGWGVLLAQGTAPRPFDGPAQRALAVRVAGLLRDLEPAAPWGGAEILVVDDLLGRHLPRDLGELLDCCVRHDVGRVVWQGAALDLDPARRRALLESAQPLPGAGLAGVEGSVARFRRFRAPVTLERAQQAAMDALDGARSVAELLQRCGAEPELVLDMQHSGLLTLAYAAPEFARDAGAPA